jgi:DNA mismatch repair ATPase MutS
MASALYDEYAALTQTYKAKYGNDTVVLKEIGSFFEYSDCDKHLGADVPRVSKILNIEVSRMNPNIGGFPIVMSEKYINLLLEAGFTIVMCRWSPSQGSEGSPRRLEVTEVKCRHN